MGMPNTSNVKNDDFPPTKADWYEMIYSDSQEKFDKNNNEYLWVELSFVGSERKAFVNLSYNEDFLWKIKEFKMAIGMGDEEPNPDPYKQTHLMVFCKNKVYDGGNWPDPKKFKAMDGGKNTAQSQPESSSVIDDDLPF